MAAQLPLLVGMAEPNDGAEVAPRPNNIVGLNLARLHQSQYIWAASEVANANGGAWGYITILLTNQDRDSSAPAHLLQ